MTKKPKRTCVFCGGYPVTREHLWPQWIGELLASRHPIPFKASLEKPGEQPRRWETPQVNITAARVCKNCNNAWMSDIENSVKPILQPMMLGQVKTFPLSPEDQIVLSRWAFKTALIADLAVPLKPSDQRLPTDWYIDFYNRRLPPDRNARIWTTAFVDPKRAAHAYRHPLLVGPRRTIPNRDSSQGTDSDDTYIILFTITMYRAVFQILTYFGGKWSPVRDGAVVTEEYLIRLWPPTGLAVGWPRNAIALDDNTLVVFTKRLDFV